MAIMKSKVCPRCYGTGSGYTSVSTTISTTAGTTCTFGPTICPLCEGDGVIYVKDAKLGNVVTVVEEENYEE